jgi:phytoene dehydrogenase-like protein
MCTSWKRKDYYFEGAMHWLTGSSPLMNIYQIWKDTGALSEDIPVFLDDPFMSVEEEGEIINLYRDIDKTAAHLSAVSPNDEKRLGQLAKDVKKLSVMDVPMNDIKGLKAEEPRRMSLGFILKMLPVLPVMRRLGKISCKDFAAGFAHPGIERLIYSVVGKDYSASSLGFTLAQLHVGDGGYPAGGSLPMAQRMAQTFKDLGGQLLLNTKVQKVVIENGKATGVMLENETLKADAVIVTQETIAAVNQLFDVPLQDAWIAELCRNTKSMVCSFICVGVRAEIPATPIWRLAEPINYAGEKITEIGFYNYTGYEGYAPAGATTLTTGLMGDTYEFWHKAKEEGRYEEEKQALAEQFRRALESKFPQAKGKIEVIDIATPLTYERYTGAYHGSWMALVGPGDKMKQYSGVVESVEGLYFAGHRINTPGGLPSAAASGRTAAQYVCRQFDAVFR